MSQNPYSLIFGKKPEQIISREMSTSYIIDSFLAEQPSQMVYILTGVRGAGKTVMMTDIAQRIKDEDNWIVIELNPERDMLEALISKLASENSLARIFKSARINLSLFGVGLEVSGEVPVSDSETALEKMLQSIKNKGKRLLITVDEAVNTVNMRTFVSSYQILIRQDLPVFLLMTGLYDNIYDIQNEKTLTFLYRAPKIELKPLNIGTIADNYRRNFNIDPDDALKMAKLTKGYSFAFQVLGYFSWEHGVMSDRAYTEYKQYLEEYVYEKIWSELSGKDKFVLNGIAHTENGKISDIRRYLNMETNQFNPYRKRLIRKGIINGETHGYIKFVLPLFDKFVIENY